ncbi:hypothetical protein GPECTOR_17g874 [Gonium pectorale]|uniref:Uncharacterized protein n=1 Tax=Gonium pectorale TaxID=33097 RepID=A0A150GK73_GONPE|nr:hypothetical protein GPECTOR_17g874 [Gonium pectorale]|eukprot:KXZ50236.1 hypothetical protein GPECTOR_17g874 [Gonium pectorale]
MSAHEGSFSSSFVQSLSRTGSPESLGLQDGARGSPRVVVSIGGACSPPDAAQTEILAEQVAGLQRQLEESKRNADSAAARWAMEREALHRQVHALIALAEGPSRPGSEGGTAGLLPASACSLLTQGSVPLPAAEAAQEAQAQAQRLQELEAMVEELQAERNNLEEQLHVAAAEAARAGRAAAAKAAPAPALSPATSLDVATPRSPLPSCPPPLPLPPARASAPTLPTPSTTYGGAPPAALSYEVEWNRNLTLTDSVSMPTLLAEKAALEHELRSLRAECVAVPRAEFAELSSARRQLAFLETEVSQLREEAEEAARLREQAEAQLAEMLASCVPVPRDEYQALLRGAAAARARSASSSSASSCASAAHSSERAPSNPATALPPVAAAGTAKMEGETEAADCSEVVVLRDQLAAAVDASVAECSRLGGRVRELEEEVTRLQSENFTLRTDVSAFRVALAAGRRQALAVASEEARAATAAAEGARAAALEELRAARQRLAGLESELAAARKEAEAATAQRDVLLADLATVRDAAVRTTQALADCEGCREAAEAAAAAAAAELAEARQELAGARGLVVRDKLRSRRLAGLPLEWMAGWGSGGSSGEQAAVEGEAEGEEEAAEVEAVGEAECATNEGGVEAGCAPRR